MHKTIDWRYELRFALVALANIAICLSFFYCVTMTLLHRR